MLSQQEAAALDRWITTPPDEIAERDPAPITDYMNKPIDSEDHLFELTFEIWFNDCVTLETQRSLVEAIATQDTIGDVIDELGAHNLINTEYIGTGAHYLKEAYENEQ